MTKEKKTEIKVGITVLAALILLVLVYGWANNYSLNSDDFTLKIRFPTVAGLEIGDLVSLNGVRKGLVKSIDAQDNYALVNVRFNEVVLLKEDASFSIMMHDLMGGKKIEISTGKSQREIDFSKIQYGVFSGDVSTAMATLNSVESDLVDVIGELKISLESANSLLGSPEFLHSIRVTIEQVKLLTENMTILIKENRTAINQTISNAQELTDKTNALLDNNSTKISSILSSLDTTLISSSNLLDKLNKLSNEVVNRENNLGKILYDEELLENLKASFQQIKELTSTINKQLNSGGLEVKADVDLF